MSFPSRPAPGAPSTLSRSIQLATRLLSAGLAVMLIQWVVVSGGADLKEEWRQCDSSYLTLAFFMLGSGAALASYRWSRLLVVQGVVLSGWDAIRLTMIGNFFNLAIPGGVGGDLVKMYKLKSQAGERYPEALMTTLFDRILGLLGLFLVAIVAVCASWGFLTHTQDNTIRYTVSFVGGVSVLGAAGVILAMYHEMLLELPFMGGLLQRLKNVCPSKLWRFVRRVVRSVSLFRLHLGEVFLALAISMVIHTLAALTVWAIGQAFHAPILRVKDYFLAAQIANTISAVPITPGGLGGRDFILLLFFHAAGEGPKSGVIPPVYSILMILLGLIGSVFFFLERQHIHIPLEPEGSEAEEENSDL